jgi:CheY-like chemotaxis protein
MMEDLPDDHPVHDDAHEILKSAERAAGLTRQLLAFSRGQAISQQIICVNDVVSSMEKLMRRVLTDNVKLITHLDPKLALTCADAGQVEQVLMNLVINARDAMPKGGTITVKTANAELAEAYLEKREEVTPGNYVMLAVSDTGVGMDAETQARVFEPFFTTKESGRGTGLGLAQVQGIVKQAGGYIFIYSETGHGTTVKIYFPNAVITKPVPEKDRLTDDGEAILVIEDEPAIRTLTKRVLESRGYNVMLVGTASEAVRALSDERIHFALAITDLVLPDTSGEQVIELIKRKRPGCKILLMSGYTVEDVRRENPKLANAEFMEKPFTPDQLSRKVRQLLDN